jgi:hypothetical protein
MYTGGQAPMMIQKAEGNVTLKFKDGSEKELPLKATEPGKNEETVYFCPMHADVVQMEPGECGKCGGMTLFKQNYMHAAYDLSDVEPGTMKAVVHMKGMKGDESEATFTVPYQDMQEHHEKMMKHGSEDHGDMGHSGGHGH